MLYRFVVAWKINPNDDKKYNIYIISIQQIDLQKENVTNKIKLSTNFIDNFKMQNNGEIHFNYDREKLTNDYIQNIVNATYILYWVNNPDDVDYDYEDEYFYKRDI